MNKRLEDAWVLLSNSTTNSVIWRKFSELKPISIRKKDYMIGFLDCCYGLNLDQVHDPKTFEIAVNDVIQLEVHTPFELFNELDKRNLLAYDDNEDASISTKKDINSQKTSIGSFDGSEFNVKMPDVSFPSYDLTA